MSRSLLIALVAAAGCTGDDVAASDAAPVDAAISSGWAYTGEVVVLSDRVMFRVGALGDGCEHCSAYERLSNGCLYWDDAVGCGPPCVPCLTDVRIAWPGGEEEGTRWVWGGWYERNLPHEANAGDRLRVVLDGCQGRYETEIELPSFTPIEVAAPAEFDDQHLRVTWSPSRQAGEVDIGIHRSLAGHDCRRADTGDEVVLGWLDRVCMVWVRALTRVEVPEQGHQVRFYTADSGWWTNPPLCGWAESAR